MPYFLSKIFDWIEFLGIESRPCDSAARMPFRAAKIGELKLLKEMLIF